jgi:hypothetical protein
MERENDKTKRGSQSSLNKDLLMGKKLTKNLPENFFEKVLDLELKLKREFTMDTLQELVNLYSVRKIQILI